MTAIDSLFFRYARIALASLTGLTTVPVPTFAANSACHGVKVEITKAREEAYGPVIVAAMESKIKPAQVKFYSILESGIWSAAYISTPVTDDGVIFFQTVDGKKHFRDVWGGWADPSENSGLVAWAQKLGAPTDLAKCFAETVTGNE